jgi:hypothetical protein
LHVNAIPPNPFSLFIKLQLSDVTSNQLKIDVLKSTPLASLFDTTTFACGDIPGNPNQRQFAHIVCNPDINQKLTAVNFT